MSNIIKVIVRAVNDKVGGLAKVVAGGVTGNRDLRDDGRAELGQAHVEAEAAAVEDEGRSAHGESESVRRIREL